MLVGVSQPAEQPNVALYFVMMSNNLPVTHPCAWFLSVGGIKSSYHVFMTDYTEKTMTVSFVCLTDEGTYLYWQV